MTMAARYLWMEQSSASYRMMSFHVTIMMVLSTSACQPSTIGSYRRPQNCNSFHNKIKRSSQSFS